MTCAANQNLILRVELKINDKRVELNNFVQGIVSETVIGMVKSLRGIEIIETIDLKISKEIKSSQAQ